MATLSSLKIMPQFVFYSVSFRTEFFFFFSKKKINETATIGSLIRCVMFQGVFPGTSWWKVGPRSLLRLLFLIFSVCQYILVCL